MFLSKAVSLSLFLMLFSLSRCWKCTRLSYISVNFVCYVNHSFWRDTDFDFMYAVFLWLLCAVYVTDGYEIIYKFLIMYQKVRGCNERPFFKIKQDFKLKRSSNFNFSYNQYLLLPALDCVFFSHNLRTKYNQSALYL